MDSERALTASSISLVESSSAADIPWVALYFEDGFNENWSVQQGC